jgi:Holliday junction resolvase
VVYIDQYQVEKVLEWVKRAGSNATGMIAIYFDRRQGWRFVPIESAVKLDSGGVKITKEDADKGLSLEKLREI